ncbi:MAG: hypothetical protein K6T75_07590 [Acetobacteraceae bacterium]|nr:hypothetical protein [Acetobacteraceae bacterium]
MDLRLVLIMLGSTLLCSLAQLLLKQGAVGAAAGGLGVFLLRAAASWKVLLGLCLYGGNMVLWLVLLRRYPLNAVYSLTALTYLEVEALCALVLREPLGWGQWAGMLMIVGGIWLVVSR